MTDARARRITQAAALMAAAAVTSRLLGIVREAVVAALFGAGDAKGAYVIAYYVPFFVQRLLLGGTLSIVFIPTITRSLKGGDEGVRGEVLSNLTGLVLAIGIGMVLLGQVIAPWIVPIAAPGFPAHLVALATSLTRILFVAMLFLALSVFLTAYLQSCEQFAVPAFAPLLFNLAIIGGALLLGPRLGIHGLAVAWVAGTALQAAVQLPAARRAGLRHRPTLDLRHPAVREVARLALPAMLGLAVVEINAYVDRFFASFLRLSGTVNAVAALDYAYEVVQAPVGFFAISIATAIFPLLSQDAAEGDLEGLRRTTSLGLRVAIFTTSPVLALYLAMPDLLVRVLFERFAFTPEATRAVAGAVAAYGAGLVSIAGYYVVTRAYYALHDMATPVRVGALMIPTNAVLDWLLMRVWGHVGIALATSIVTTLNVGILLWLLRRRLGTIQGRRIGQTAVRAALGALAVGLVAWAASRAPIQALEAGIAARLVTALVAAGIAYLGASAVLRSEELHLVLDLVRRPPKGARFDRSGTPVLR
jgi:putative peptidoglycan lipid II flippase